MNIHEAGVSARSVRYFFTPSSFAEQMFYYPTRIGHYFCNREYMFSNLCEIALQAGHRLNYMLFLVKQGKMSLEIDGKTYSAGAKQLVLFDCKRPHSYRAITDDVEFYWMLFNGAQSVQFYEMLIEQRVEHVFSIGDTMQIQLLLSKMLTYGEMSQLAQEHRYSETIYGILCQLLMYGTVETGDYEAVISRAISYMDMYYESNLTVETVASHVGLSASYFTKQFRMRTGYSPYEYITLRRIQHAKEMLVSSTMTVKQIAFETGYHSEENFIRNFKKKVGMSPGAFRKVPM